MTIHPTALVEATNLPDDVTIHAYAVVRDGVTFGRNVTVHPHVVVESGVSIGDDVEIAVGAVVGKQPAKTPALSRETTVAGMTVIASGVCIGVHAVVYSDVRSGRAR